ncbi:DUF6009 family protein [Streptomyces sp. N35]|uniref:DUF6009 family protein n=1 Tax=Streptomyces sp. N35 TaxID=2795730 RepID=UPI0018F666BF|nr:DUF6009 family protein [Streptomyces sp. N35]
MSSLLDASQLVDEEAVVWLEPIENLDYVRQTLDKTKNGRGRPAYFGEGRLVGYVDLIKNSESKTQSGLFRRRKFYLLPHDRPNRPGGRYAKGAPGEAVDPRTVEPGKVGVKTQRVLGEAPSQIVPAGS